MQDRPKVDSSKVIRKSQLNPYRMICKIVKLIRPRVLYKQRHIQDRLCEGLPKDDQFEGLSISHIVSKVG